MIEEKPIEMYKRVEEEFIIVHNLGYKGNPFDLKSAMMNVDNLITKERLAWEKKVADLELAKNMKIADLEQQLSFAKEPDDITNHPHYVDLKWHCSNIQSKLDEAVKALEWYAKNNTKTPWQRKRAEEAIRKIKE